DHHGVDVLGLGRLEHEMGRIGHHRHVERVGADGDQVGALAGRERADLAVEAERARAADGAELERVARRHLGLAQRPGVLGVARKLEHRAVGRCRRAGRSDQRCRRSLAQARIISSGTTASSLELRSVSEVLTLRTCGAAVSSVTKAWKVLRSGATHLRMKSISPESIQHSRTSGWARTKSSKALRSASAWLVRGTMAK